MSNVCHFLGFNMHQPQGNLLDLVEREPWTAHQILLAYQRPIRYAERYQDDARFCVCFSGILLEQLQDEHVLRRYEDEAKANGFSDVVDVPKMLKSYRDAMNIELAGTGYYHPLFPIVPEADWDAQIARGSDKVEEIFARKPDIFWPPEAGFNAPMIPHLADHGYKYVVCDGVHLKPDEGLSAGEIIYSMHVAEQDGKSIILIPRDGQLSLAQQGGMDPEWFDDNVRRKTDGIGASPLVTTWTDGENGGWFLQTDDAAGYWGFFFAPYIEKIREGNMAVRLKSLSDYVKVTLPIGKASILAGTWKSKTEKADGSFRRWAELDEQQEALRELQRVSHSYHEIVKQRLKQSYSSPDSRLESAYVHILRAEASDNLWWQEAWIPKLYKETALAWELLDQIQIQNE